MPAIWTRRALCQRAAGPAIAALAAPALGGWPLVGARSASAASENATRAVDAYRTMQRHFYVERDLLYREFAPTTATTAASPTSGPSRRRPGPPSTCPACPAPPRPTAARS